MEEMSKYQRLVLINQYLILEKLDPDMAKSYENTRIALESGYPNWYEKFDHTYVFDGLTLAECQEASDILNMFWLIGPAYDKLEDKSGIDEHSVQFQGFDGNDGTGYLGYSEYVIERQGRFKGLHAMNSHSDNIDMYRRMLAEFKKSKNHKLTKDDLVRITDAAIHPSMRK